MTKEKILFVIPRYGKDMHGGAEWHCQQIAERITEKYEVEVATTKAVDYRTWRNDFKNDTEELNGVLIRRFKTDRERAKDHAHTEALLRSNVQDLKMNIKWIIDQGPLSSDLIKFLHENHQNYKKIVVFQYLYTLNYMAIKALPAEKIIFVPLAHDEPQVRYPIFRESFRKPEWIVYNSEIEYDLVKRVHFTNEKNSSIAAVGIEAPDLKDVDVPAFKKKFGVDNYIVFIGRIDPAKRVDVLIQDFILHKQNYPSDLKLVLVGKVVVPPKEHPDVITTGFVSESEKYASLAGALALVNPSPYESLSLIVLESFFMKRPIIVNAYCDVLKYHCLQSNGGLWYETHLEFDGVINYLKNHPEEAKEMGENGYKYAIEKYNWDVVLSKWFAVLEA